MTSPSAKARFWTSVATSLGLLVGIAILPKDPSHGDTLRLGMTIVFMIAATSLVWSFLDPFDAFLTEQFDERYRGAGAEIANTTRLLRVNLMAPVRRIAWMLIASLCLLSVHVLSPWPLFAVLQPFDDLLSTSWTLCLVGLAAFFVIDEQRISQAFNLAHQLREQVATSGFKPRLPAAPTRSSVSLRLIEPERFEAGGFVWNWSDFYKNFVVFGQVGSGKTVCVLNPLLQGLVSSGQAGNLPAGLILDPKGDFFHKIKHIMDDCDRGDDLVVFDPDNPQSLQWNPLDTPDSAEEVANRFGAVFAMQGQGGGNDGFFIQQSKMFLQHALTLLRIRNTDGTPPSVGDILNAVDDVGGLVVDALQVTDIDSEKDRDRRAAHVYFYGTWEKMASETQSGVISTLSTVLSPFNNRPFDRLMSGRSTISLGQIIDRGKVLYVHMPTARRKLMAQTVGTLLKTEFSRQVLSRRGKERPSFFFCDEFQEFITTDREVNDADFFGLCRESNHCNVVATQNRPALLQRDKKSHAIDHLLACCGTKVFLRNTDPETNEWASKQFSEELRSIVSTGQSTGTMRRHGAKAGASLTATTSYARVVKPDAFIRLKQPSRPEGIEVAESIILFTARAQVEVLNLRWAVHPL